MTAGRVSDYMGAAALLQDLPKAEWLLADRGYDADWYREALKDKGIKVCIPGRKNRKKKIRHDRRRYKRSNRIEIVWPPQRLAQDRNPLRPMSPSLAVGHRPRSNRYLLALKVNES
jgi:IS5 family transposase